MNYNLEISLEQNRSESKFFKGIEILLLTISQNDFRLESKNYLKPLLIRNGGDY